MKKTSWNKGLTKENSEKWKNICKSISLSRKGKSFGRRVEYISYSCKNPMCDNKIECQPSQVKHKKYCCDRCRKNHKFDVKKERQDDFVISNCRNCGNEIKTHRQNCGNLIPRKLCDNCNKELRRNVCITQKWYDSMSKINWNKQTSIEKIVEFALKNNNIEYEPQQRISNFIVDFLIPNNKTIIECFGDYWHMNPKRYNESDFNKSIKKSAKQVWEKDLRRIKFLQNRGFNVMVLWESDIKNQTFELKLENN